MRRLMLVQAPLSSEASKTPNVGVLPPLGLLSLATYLHSKNYDLDIDVVDVDYSGLEKTKEIISIKKPDIVGIGVLSCESYMTALELAQEAKNHGAVVVLGGEQASLRARQILRNREFVDYVIVAHGETALEKLIFGEDLEKIPNLVYRRGEEIIENPIMRLPLSSLPIPRRDYIDLRGYAERFQWTTESKLTGFKSFTTAKTQDGCLKAIKGDVCSFCKRTDLLLAGFRKPEIFWDETEYLESLGVDYVWDVSASFAGVERYLKKLAAIRPQAMKIKFRVYARADDLARERTAEALALMGVDNVLVGFDSGNQRCLDSSNKQTTIEQHLQAARNLRKFGIATYSGFVLGHLAETEESMIDTLNHAKELREIIGERLFRITTCSKMQPYPDTVEYHTLLKTDIKLKEKVESSDDIDIQEFSELYFKNVLHLDPEKADEIAYQIRGLSPIKSGKDMKQTTAH